MANKRAFRFGLAADSTPTGEEWAALARRAEDLGYSTFLQADHFVNDFACLPALAMAAAATTRLRVGSFVFDNDFRHPAIVAKEAATLDLLTGGRFELGIGAGWHKPEYDQAGIPFEPAGVRLGKLEEAVQIIRGLFGEEPVTFHGEYYTINGMQGTPRPAQKPGPPVYIGGGGKRILGIAARYADIVGVHMRSKTDGSGGDITSATAEATREKVGWVREAAGDRFDGLELSTLVSRVVITEDRRGTAENLAVQANRPGLTAGLLLDSPYYLIGTLQEIEETINRWRDEYFISYVVVLDNVMNEFAPVVARLGGE